MRKIVISLTLIIFLLLGVRAFLSYWFFMHWVHSFDALVWSVPSSDSTMSQELRAIERDFTLSNRIKSTGAATKNQAYIAELLRTLKTKKTDPQKDTSTPANNESAEKDSKSNNPSGTGASQPSSGSGSTPKIPPINEPSKQKVWTISTGSTIENSSEIRSRIADLKELQLHKGDYTRPDGTVEVPLEKSLMEQFFANEPLFGNDWETGDY